MEEQVIEAVRLLYSASTDASTRQQVSAFLESFQNRMEAWGVATGIVSGEYPPELVLYAAQTLKHKVC